MSFGIYAIQFYVQSSLPLLRRFLLVSLCYITIFKWADTFELHMEIQYLVKADIFLRFVFFDQGGHGCPDL